MGRNPFSHASSQRNQMRLNLLLTHKPGGRLLDLGCGDGGFAIAANPYFQVEGIDLHPRRIQPRRRGAAPRIVRANINNVELQTGGYDVITMFNVLEHLSAPYSVLQETYSGLKAGGVLFGSVPNNRWLAGKIHTLVSNLFDKTHCSTFHPSRWREYLERAGFRSISLLGEILLAKRGF